MDFTNIGREWNNDNFGTGSILIQSVVPSPQFDRYVRLDDNKKAVVVHQGRNIPEGIEWDVHYEAIRLVFQALDSNGKPIGTARSLFADKSKLSLQLHSYANVKAVLSIANKDLGVDAENARLQKLIEEEKDTLVQIAVDSLPKAPTAPEKAKLVEEVMAQLKARAHEYRYQQNVRRVEIDPESNLATKIASVVAMYGIEGAGQLANALR